MPALWANRVQPGKFQSVHAMVITKLHQISKSATLPDRAGFDRSAVMAYLAFNIYTYITPRNTLYTISHQTSRFVQAQLTYACGREQLKNEHDDPAVSQYQPTARHGQVRGRENEQSNK
jgi:hypothetical protein